MRHQTHRHATADNGESSAARCSGRTYFQRPHLEVSFTKNIQSLRLKSGDTFHGEGILTITKALPQPGVAYVGGYQGAPVSHLLDVMVRLNREINKILGMQAVKDRITALGGEALPLTPQEFGAKASDDSQRFGTLIRERKIMGD